MTGLPEPDVLRAELTAAGVFDAAWYLRRNADVAAALVDPLSHFVHDGWKEGRSPNRFFDPAWYRLANPDVAASQIDPLLHYLRDGAREGRRPHPLFDPGWYRGAYGVAGDVGVLGHYLANRFAAGTVPSPELFAAPLLPPYRGDPAAGIDPVGHYLDDCEARAREPFPHLDAVRAARLVDENYYLVGNTDVYEANLDPTEHYCRHGWREHRKPNIYFDPDWYGATNPDPGRLKIDPLLHYILVGEATGRRPGPFFDPLWYRAEYAVPDDRSALGHYLANRRTRAFSPTPLFDIGWYMDRFGTELGPNRDLFMHFLQAGIHADIDPSRGFDAAGYRRAHLGRPSRRFGRMARPEQHNPLVHFLRTEYAALNTGT